MAKGVGQGAEGKKKLNRKGRKGDAKTTRRTRTSLRPVCSTYFFFMAPAGKLTGRAGRCIPKSGRVAGISLYWEYPQLAGILNIQRMAQRL